MFTFFYCCDLSIGAYVGLSNMRASWSLLPSSVKLSFIVGMKKHVSLMKEDEITKTISGLGRLGARWIDIPQTVQAALADSFIRNLKFLSPRGLAMSIHGFGRMRMDISDVSVSFRNTIMSAIISVAPKFGAQEISNALYGLGRMKASFGGVQGSPDVFPVKVRKALLETLEREVNSMTPEATSNALLGLSQMKVEWLKISTSLQTALMDALRVKAPQMTEASIRNVVHALGVMVVDWKRDVTRKGMANEGILSAVEENIASASPQSVMSMLYGFEAMKFTWNEFPPKLLLLLDAALESLLQKTSSEEAVSALVHCLAGLQAQWSDLSSHVQLSIEESIARSGWEPLSSNSSSTSSAFLTTKNDAASPNDDSSLAVSYLSQLSSSQAASMLLSPVKSAVVIAPTGFRPSSLLADAVTFSDGSSSGGSSSSLSVDNHRRNPRKHFLCALSEMGIKWENIHFSSRLAIFRSLSRALRAMRGENVVCSLHSMSDIGMKWAELPTHLRAVLVEALERISGETSDEDISSVIMSLATMEVCWADDIPLSLQASLRKAIAKQTEIGEHALSNLMYGLGKLARRWSELHPSVRQTLTAALIVCHERKQYSSAGIANTMYGLAHMKVDWNLLPTSLRLAMISDVSKVVSQASEVQFTAILGSLGKCSVDWEAHLSDGVRRKLLSELYRRLPVMSGQQIATVTHALGTMGVVYTSLSREIKQRLNSAVKAYCEEVIESSKRASISTTVESNSNSGRDPSFQAVNPQSMSMLLVGLDRIEASWSFLAEDTVVQLLEAIRVSIPSMNAAQLSNTLFGMSKIVLRWDQFSDDLKRDIVQGIMKLILTGNVTNTYHIATTIQAMGTLGLRFSLLAQKVPTFTRAFHRAIQRVMRAGSASQMSSLVLGMGFMECTWSDLAEEVRSSIEEGISRTFSAARLVVQRDGDTMEPFMNERNVAASSTASSSSSPTSSSTSKSMSPIRGVACIVDGSCEIDSYVEDTNSPVISVPSLCLANTMYGLSLMIFDCQDERALQDFQAVHEVLTNAVSHLTHHDFSNAEKEQVLIYRYVSESVLSGVTPAASATAATSTTASASQSSGFDAATGSKSRFPNVYIQSIDTHKKTSHLQHSVVKSITKEMQIRNDDLTVRKEFSSFRGAFPIDATVFEDDEPVAFVEVDGPHHYHEGGVLRRKDIMKESLYRQKYPCATFTRIKFDQVHHFGPIYVGREVANYITLSMHTCCLQHSDMVEQYQLHHADQLTQAISAQSLLTSPLTKTKRSASQTDIPVSAESTLLASSYPRTATTSSAPSNAVTSNTSPILNSIPQFSSLPDYVHVEGWIARRALIALHQALDWQSVPQRRGHFFVNSPVTDFAFADVEEDNS